jgi:hypothetical protein
MMNRFAEASPRLRARTAGGLYLLGLLTAAITEVFVRGWLNIAGGLLAVLIMAAMTLILYDIFKPVDRRLSLLAAAFSFVGLAFEATRSQPEGVNIAVVFNGFYCLVLGYLILRASFLPRFLGALIAVSGLGWLTFVSPSLAELLSPYNLATGVLGEALVMLWLLAMGVHVQHWKEQAGEGQSRPDIR